MFVTGLGWLVGKMLQCMIWDGDVVVCVMGRSLGRGRGSACCCSAQGWWCWTSTSALYCEGELAGMSGKLGSGFVSCIQRQVWREDRRRGDLLSEMGLRGGGKHGGLERASLLTGRYELGKQQGATVAVEAERVELGGVVVDLTPGFGRRREERENERRDIRDERDRERKRTCKLVMMMRRENTIEGICDYSRRELRK
ncbi:uncharacterized protein A4U43_C08F28830 [Asparagus officinalis]|nr:uncharacterized protein A4U43_C08F28830 [Asparagus officinalis]